MDYIIVKKAAEKWGIIAGRAQVLCAQDKISGAIRFDNTWAIPKDAVKPESKCN
ncbi:DNA-binding protein [Desulfosporosinus sp. BICA1-9]|uniref:DNA-binding protein n=1 Tax=Desulfosporosinus sp. BICA1-9 TaxID=1531958 RepID=UPI000ABC824D|nr:DNA-binding protein [Desulfosporosinus sp. BICA1-9]